MSSHGKRTSALQTELNRIVPLLATNDVERIILFGSLSRKDVYSHSDIDLLIIKHTEKRFLDRLEDVYRIVMPKCAPDVLVYSPEEIVKYQSKNSFLHKILSEGTLLYEREQGFRSFQMANSSEKRLR